MWEILLERERLKYPAVGRTSEGGVRGAGPREGLRAGQSPCGVDLGDALHLHKEDIAGALCGYLEHQRRVQFEGCVAEPLQTITTTLPGSKWSCLLLRIVCVANALSAVTKIYRPLKLRVFVDDTTALLMEKNKEVAEIAKKVMKRQREEVEKKVPNCRSRRMERKERVRLLLRVASWRTGCVRAAKKEE